MNPAASASVPVPVPAVAAPDAEPVVPEPGVAGGSAVRNTLLVVAGGQLERVLGTANALALRWFLAPELLGVYTGLRLYLDNTNRSSLGISLGAVQEAPILRARGEVVASEHLINVAHTTNCITSIIYALVLLAGAAWRYPSLREAPFGVYWIWGLALMAIFAPLKRYQDFLTAVHRARQHFWLVTRLQVLDTLVFTVLMIGGMLLFGFWGLLLSVGVLMFLNVIYMHVCSPMRLRWAWDFPVMLRLMRVGLPIWANALLFMFLCSLDRMLILGYAPQPERMAGLYTVALMGTTWGMDLAGRIVLVMYTYFQTTLGVTRDEAAVARQALRVTEAQAPLILAGSAAAYVAGPTFLGWIMPGYEEGLPAIRPLLPGMIALGLTLVSRQVLITLNRAWTLGLITCVGLAVTAFAGWWGLRSGGLVGVAWGMTIGYVFTYVISDFTAYLPILGYREFFRHQRYLAFIATYYLAGALLAAHCPLPLPAFSSLRTAEIGEFVARCGVLACWGCPGLWHWGRSHGWGGLAGRRAR